MKRRSGWIVTALFGIGLLFAVGAAQGARADSHEAAAGETEAVEPLEEAAEAAGEQAQEKVKAGKRRRDADRGAAARGKKARADEKAAKRKAKRREKKGGEEARKGGRARERRSERAARRANPQWQEDASRGQERAGAVRDTGEETAEGELGEGEMEERGADARRGKGEPPEQAKGFWRRFFGGDDDEEE
jgi:hypothetical protein